MWSAQSFGDRQDGEATQAANVGVLVMGGVLVILQAVSAPFGTSGDLTAVGILAGVLGWLMWRVEKRLEEIRLSHEQAKTSIDRLVRAILVLSLSREDGDHGSVKAAAEQLLQEIGKDKP